MPHWDCGRSVNRGASIGGCTCNRSREERRPVVQEWKEIPGWPAYRISNDGRLQTCSNHGGLATQIWKDKKPTVDADGYLRTSLHHRKRSVFTGIHDLVLIAFGGPRPPGKSMALHRNGNRQDNRIENLRWGFGDDNARDRDEHGNTARHERHGNAKLTWADVHEIRRLKEQGLVSVQQIATAFSVSKKCVLNIVHNRTWIESKATVRP